MKTFKYALVVIRSQIYLKNNKTTNNRPCFKLYTLIAVSVRTAEQNRATKEPVKIRAVLTTKDNFLQ